MVTKITDSEFENEVTNAELPVLVDFWAQWCGPCRMIAPILDQLSQEMEGKLKIVKINIDDNPQTPSTLGVKSIPTMMIFQNGEVKSMKIGALPKDNIKDWINSII